MLARTIRSRHIFNAINWRSSNKFSQYAAVRKLIPMVTESEGRSILTYDIFSKLLKERIVLLTGPIYDEMASSIVAQLLYLESENQEKPVFLYINSPGGEVSAGLAVYDTMQYVKCPVSTICIGQASSAASLLLVSGAAGKRFALPNASIMLHQPSGGYSGQASDIKIHAENILKIRERLNKIYQKHMTVPISQPDIEKIMERDTFLSSEEALNKGIIDEILTHR